ncbi:MAG: hypothetical protein JSW12_06240 [Deltaproteobacteria bacterium]|nr:MAG: hypothetical protein JSW12_06240 [Deltaproteobacteria bacterium]
MARLTSRDIQEILQALEDGIRFIPNLSKAEKLTMRNKIRKQFIWLSELSSPTAGMVFHELEKRLSDVFSLYPYGVSDKVKELLQEKLMR